MNRDRKENHSTSLPLDVALDLETLIAVEMFGKPIGNEHGGPIRNIVPGRYFYKSVKWLTKIELLVKDKLGYWEAETGYHNNADPWKQERYMVPHLDRRTVIRLLESRDFSGRNLRSIDASDRVLDGLNARQALLRDANFEKASLVAADFSGANLSNAHLAFASLQGAKFVGTDLEGADLSGADLSGADLTGCSLIGSSFCQSNENGRVFNGAKFDSHTILPIEKFGPADACPVGPTSGRNSDRQRANRHDNRAVLTPGPLYVGPLTGCEFFGNPRREF